jgi:cytochrome P450
MSESTAISPVADWATDYDIFDPQYIADPFGIWDGLREHCPVAHSDRWGGSWLPTSYDDVFAMAQNPKLFSSRSVGVVPPQLDPGATPFTIAPIGVDAPMHTWTRRLMLPWFSHTRVEGYEENTRALCRRLILGGIETGRIDAAQDYAQQIPVRVIGQILGVPEDMSDDFTGWVRDVLEFAHDNERRARGRNGLAGFFIAELEKRRQNPGDDLISELLHTEVDGAPIPDGIVLGMSSLTLIAGVDTTWSAIGSALWHLATHPEDCRRLVNEPELIDTAVEEFLRVYSPVTMARIVTEDTEFKGCPMHEGDRVLMNFPGANRDPGAFERADEFIIDRQINRHLAFGAGIHRCAGSNLARMELRVAIEEWLKLIPTFALAQGAEVSWAGGQVRGPRSIPVVFSVT